MLNFSGKISVLDQLGIAHQTDKASQFSRTYALPHNYLVHLERFVEPIRFAPIKIVEIGVGGGESVQTWLEYFERADVFGVDIIANTNPWNTPEVHNERRYRFFAGNQGHPSFWQYFIETTGGNFDFVCDDGSHLASDMKVAFTCLWPHVVSGGIYVVEDLNFDAASKVWTEGFIKHIHAGTTDVDSIYFAKELAILRKK